MSSAADGESISGLLNIQFDSGPRILATTTVLLVLSTISVGLRYYVRIGMLKKFGWDDGFLLVAYLIFIGNCAQAYYQVQIWGGSGSVFNKLKPIGALIYSQPVSYFLVLLFLKWAMAVFFLKIVVVRAQRIIIIATVVVYTAFAIAITFLTLFKCGAPNWQKALHGYDSPDCTVGFQTMSDMTWVHAAVNAATDWILALSPIFAIAHLKLRPIVRLSACSLILLGILGSIAAVVRLPYLAKINDPDNSVSELVRATANVVIVSEVEAGLGIIALSLAALRPLLGKVADAYKTVAGTGQGSVPTQVNEMASSATTRRSDAGMAMSGISKTTRVVFEEGEIQTMTINEEQNDFSRGSIEKKYPTDDIV